jgi:hypothetical protein
MTPLELFPTPEEAAMQGFPPAHCRVLAVEVNGKDGFVLLDTGPAEYRYLYGGTVEQLPGGWCGGTDSNGGGVGWTLTDDAREVGVVAVCGESPHGADAVRVEWRGERREPLVRDGVYFVTWWREPSPEGDWPQVTAFRIGGDWVIAHSQWAPSTTSHRETTNHRAAA